MLSPNNSLRKINIKTRLAQDTVDQRQVPCHVFGECYKTVIVMSSLITVLRTELQLITDHRLAPVSQVISASGPAVPSATAPGHPGASQSPSKALPCSPAQPSPGSQLQLPQPCPWLVLALPASSFSAGSSGTCHSPAQGPRSCSLLLLPGEWFSAWAAPAPRCGAQRTALGSGLAPSLRERPAMPSQPGHLAPAAPGQGGGAERWQWSSPVSVAALQGSKVPAVLLGG